MAALPMAESSHVTPRKRAENGYDARHAAGVGRGGQNRDLADWSAETKARPTAVRRICRTIGRNRADARRLDRRNDSYVCVGGRTPTGSKSLAATARTA